MSFANNGLNPPPLPQSSKGFHGSEDIPELKIMGNLHIGSNVSSKTRSSTGGNSSGSGVHYGVLTGFLNKETRGSFSPGNKKAYLVNRPDIVSPSIVDTNARVPFPENIIYLPAGAAITGIYMCNVTDIPLGNTESLNLHLQDFNCTPGSTSPCLAEWGAGTGPALTTGAQIGNNVANRECGAYIKQAAQGGGGTFANLPLARAIRDVSTQPPPSPPEGLKQNVASGQPEDCAIVANLTQTSWDNLPGAAWNKPVFPILKVCIEFVVSNQAS